MNREQNFMNDHTGILRTTIHQREDGPCACAECRALKYAINELSGREAREILGHEYQKAHAADPRINFCAPEFEVAVRAVMAALTRREAQQEAQGAVRYVRWHPKHGFNWKALDDEPYGANENWRSVALFTTPPAPVDVRVPMSRIIELLAQLVNAPQTDDEFDADVIRRDFVMEKVTQLRMAWDELSKAQRALLDGQPADTCTSTTSQRTWPITKA